MQSVRRKEQAGIRIEFSRYPYALGCFTSHKSLGVYYGCTQIRKKSGFGALLSCRISKEAYSNRAVSVRQ